MGNQKKSVIVTVWVTAVAGLAWLLSGAIRGWLLGHPTRLPGQFVALLFPETLARRTWQSVEPWPALLALASVVTMMAITAFFVWVIVTRSEHRSPGQRLGFLSLWMGVVLAAFSTAAFTSLGYIVATWPPARVAALLDGIEPLLFAAGYWGIIWGWIPAWVGSRLTRSAESSHKHKPATKRSTEMALLLSAGVLAVTLMAAFPAAHRSTEDARAMSESSPPPVQTPEPVVYGSPEVSHAFQPPGKNWCEGDEVAISWQEPEGATGHRGMRFELTNTGTGPCLLESYPDIAFDNVDGWAMDVLVVHGGSFMTDDPGVSAVTVLPGQGAQAFLGWNAMAAAGDMRTGTMLVAPYPGTLRHSSPVDLDIIDGGAVSLTAWAPIKEDPAAIKNTRPKP